jgi:hypothetical protein
VPANRASPANAGALSAAGENVCMPKHLRSRRRERSVLHSHDERNCRRDCARAQRDLKVHGVIVGEGQGGRRAAHVRQRATDDHGARASVPPFAVDSRFGRARTTPTWETRSVPLTNAPAEG